MRKNECQWCENPDGDECHRYGIWSSLCHSCGDQYVEEQRERSEREDGLHGYGDE